jgi:hypothetical protein
MARLFHNLFVSFPFFNLLLIFVIYISFLLLHLFILSSFFFAFLLTHSSMLYSFFTFSLDGISFPISFFRVFSLFFFSYFICRFIFFHMFPSLSENDSFTTLISSIFKSIDILECIQGDFESCADILITSYWLHVELGKNI